MTFELTCGFLSKKSLNSFFVIANKTVSSVTFTDALRFVSPKSTIIIKGEDLNQTPN